MSPSRRSSRDLPELITLVLSIGIVAALVGGVAFVQLSSGDRPPVISAGASLDEIQAVVGGFQLQVVVRNDGDRAAEAIRLVVVQEVEGRTSEHEIEIDFLAGGAVARATVILRSDPRRSTVRVEVRSFQSGN